jgi:hypothetical protein
MKMVQRPHEVMDGIRRTYTFENGLLLSAIKTKTSYGGKDGLWEIGVLRDGEFITKKIFPTADDDVIGWVNDEDLYKHLEIINNYVEAV